MATSVNMDVVETKSKEVKKRHPDFSPIEMDYLFEVAGKYASIIESKETNGVFAKKKKDAWEKITFEFNVLPGVHKRDSKNIKMCWQNIKKKTRKIVSALKVERMKTGGGPCVDSTIKLESIHNKMMGMLPQQFMPLTNPFDCDSAYNQENVINEKEPIGLEQMEDIIFGTVSDVTVEVDDQLAADLLEEPVHKILVEVAPLPKLPKDVLHRTPNAKDPSQDIHHKPKTPKAKKQRLNPISVVEQSTRDFHSMRMKYMEEEHQLKMKSLAEEHALRCEHEKEEHYAKMELLRLKIKNEQMKCI